jgi:hypothetical protein
MISSSSQPAVQCRRTNWLVVPILHVLGQLGEAVDDHLQALAAEHAGFRGDVLLPMLEDVLGVGAQLGAAVLVGLLAAQLRDGGALLAQLQLEPVDGLGGLEQAGLVVLGDVLAALARQDLRHPCASPSSRMPST